jgi:uncharacterized protein YdaU (DUF1376 family)
VSTPWTAFYWADHVADTVHLGLAQEGAYFRLMAHYYRKGRPLQANPEQLHRICRCTTDEDKRAVQEVLAEFFTLDGQVYRHRRIEAELAKTADISEKRRAAARAKHQKITAAHEGAAANAGACALQMDTQPQSQSQLQSRSLPQPQAHPEVSKPSAARTRKRQPNGEARSADPRHVSTERLIKELHLATFGVACPWDGSEGKVLHALLAANPSWTQEQLDRMVSHRFQSESIAAERPRKWLADLGAYVVAPLDRFGKLLDSFHTGDTHNDSSHTGNRAEQRRDSNLAALRAAKDKLGLDHGTIDCPS